uniref:Uncharacterized protein n=1 Tax=Aegilops tauschii subsp. strangulata TaxID=200361 RepID=A0A453LUS8_AEGTS
RRRLRRRRRHAPRTYSRRYKVCSWIAIIFCAQSLANMKNFENDLKQLSMAFM